MKFMQRAAASAAPTPGSDSDAPSAKKRKLGHGSGDDQFSANIDQASIQAAIDEREAKRQAAIEKHGGNDTHWVLNANWDKKQGRTQKRRLNIVYVGYGDLDPSDDESSEGASKPGRTSTTNYKTSKTPVGPLCPRELRLWANDMQTPGKQGDPVSGKGSTDEDEGSQDDSNVDSPTPHKARSRSQSRSNSKQSNEVSKAKEFRDKRKKKEVRLNGMSSISSAGANQFGSPSQNSKSITCYTCQQTGHKASDCPKKGLKGSKDSSKRG